MADDDWLELSPPALPSQLPSTAAPAPTAPPSRAPKPPQIRDAPPSLLQTTEGVSFFLVRGNPYALSFAIENSVWEFQSNPRFEASVNFAFLSRPHVILIFASGTSIHGYARMTALASERKRNREKSSIEVTWFRKCVLEISEVENLRNSLAGNRPVKSAADGEELAAAAGRAICRLLDRISFNDDPVAYRPERELLPSKQRKLARRFENPDELRLTVFSYEKFGELCASLEDAGLPLPSRRFRKL